jgi:hypothetical protein
MSPEVPGLHLLPISGAQEPFVGIRRSRGAHFGSHAYHMSMHHDIVSKLQLALIPYWTQTLARRHNHDRLPVDFDIELAR